MSSPLIKLSDDVLAGIVGESPDFAAALNLEGASRLWPDISEDGNARRAAKVRDWADRLEHTPVTDDERWTAGVLRYVLNDGFLNRLNGRSSEPVVDQFEPLTHLNGAHAIAGEMLAHDHGAGGEAAGELRLERMAGLSTMLDQAAEVSASRRARGLGPCRMVMERAIADIGASRTDRPEDHMFYRQFAAAKGSPAQLEKAARLIEADIAPAYDRLIAEMGRGLDAAGEGDGACRRPGGVDFYAWRFRGHTTSDLGLEQAHALGLEEMARVQGELTAIFRQLDVPADINAGFEALGRDRRYTQDKAGRAEALAHARDIVARSKEAVRPLFNLWPSTDSAVEPIEEESEISRNSTYNPPRDGEPGVFWINLRTALAQPKFEAPALCFHEVWPGHHLQIALSQELPLPPFRRAVLFNAYMEGWAKYSEALPEEVGMATDLVAKAARLRMELYSTVNLVMDTGINAFGWSAEQGARFFAENTGAGGPMTEMVVLRSLAQPGQLCSYKVGMMQVRSLKQRFTAARGDRYRVQDFHDAILGQGCLPLSLLDRAVMEAAEPVNA
jgi:uncharacterized protein (DUF885 family)